MKKKNNPIASKLTVWLYVVLFFFIAETIFVTVNLYEEFIPYATVLFSVSITTTLLSVIIFRNSIVASIISMMTIKDLEIVYQKLEEKNRFKFFLEEIIEDSNKETVF